MGSSSCRQCNICIRSTWCTAICSRRPFWLTSVAVWFFPVCENRESLGSSALVPVHDVVSFAHRVSVCQAVGRHALARRVRMPRVPGPRDVPGPRLQPGRGLVGGRPGALRAAVRRVAVRRPRPPRDAANAGPVVGRSGVSGYRGRRAKKGLVLLPPGRQKEKRKHRKKKKQKKTPKKTNNYKKSPKEKEEN